MKTGCAKIVPIPTKEKSKLEATMGRDMDSLIGLFRELREIEAMTGRTGLSARVRVYITGRFRLERRYNFSTGDIEIFGTP